MPDETVVDALHVRVFDDPRALGVAPQQHAADGASRRDRRRAATRTSCSRPATRSSPSSPRSCSTTAIDWSRVTGFHMDEYVGIAADHPASFQRYMRERVAERLPSRRSTTSRATRPMPERGGERYAELLRDAPARPVLPRHRRERSPRVQRPARRRLRRPARRQGRRARRRVPPPAGRRGPLRDVDDVPTHAITVTIPALLRAPTVLAIVPEARKAEPVRTCVGRPDRAPRARRRSCAANRTRPSTSTPVGLADSSALEMNASVTDRT